MRAKKHNQDKSIPQKGFVKTEDLKFMAHRTRLIYRIPSFKEGITRIFDLSGGIKDDFAVVSVPKKHDSVQAKAHDPLKEGDRVSRKYNFQ